MTASKHILVLILSLFLAVNAAFSTQDTETVVSDGLGTDLDSAIQNAVENAMIQLVGSFVETRKSIEKRAEIRNAVKTQTKTISSRTSEFSQGSVEKINVLDSAQDGDFVRVTAEVTVRLEEFKAYMTRTALAETSVQQGLFSKVQVQKEQSENLGEIVVDRLMMEIFNLEVIQLEVEAVDTIKDAQLEASVRRVLSPAPNETIIEIPVKATIDEQFLANAFDTLEKTAERGLRGGQVRSYANDPHNKGDMKFWVFFADLSPKGSSITDVFGSSGRYPGYFYRALNSNLANKFKDVGSMRLYAFAESKVNDLCAYVDSKRMDEYDRPDTYWPHYYVPSVNLKILSSSGEALIDTTLTDSRMFLGTDLVSSNKAFVVGENECRGSGPCGLNSGGESALTFLQYSRQSRPGEQCVFTVDIASEFSIYAKLTDDELARAAGITVSLER